MSSPVELSICHRVWIFEAECFCDFETPPVDSLSESFLLKRYGFVFWSTHGWTWWLSSTSCPKLSTTSPPLMSTWTPTRWVYNCSVSQHSSFPLTVNLFSVLIVFSVYRTHYYHSQWVASSKKVSGLVIVILGSPTAKISGVDFVANVSHVCFFSCCWW